MRKLSVVICLVTAASIALGAQLGGRPVDEWIKTLDGPTRVSSLKIDDVVAAMKLKPGEIVADIGAGTGLLSVPVAKAVGPKGRVYAVEIDAGFFPAVLKRSADNGVSNVHTVLGEFTDPKLPGRVDFIFFHDVLHHIEKRGDYLRKLGSYLTPRGRVMVVDFEAGKGPHAREPELEVSREWLAGVMGGYVLVSDEKLFDNKYVLTFGIKWMTGSGF